MYIQEWRKGFIAIPIKRDQAKILKALRVTHRETYWEIIKRLIDYWNNNHPEVKKTDLEVVKEYENAGTDRKERLKD